MLLPGTQRQTPTQAVRTVAKQQETQAHSGKRRGDWGEAVEELVKGKAREKGDLLWIKTHLTLGYEAACVVIKRLCLSAGVRRVTRWRWDDAVRSYTLIS